MAITRARALALLNKREMSLYDDSRLNALRKLDAAAIDKRIALMRDARDRARDLVQRQKLASRATTGAKRGITGKANQRSKDKAELLADMLARFREHAPVARKRDAARKRAVASVTSRKSPTPAKATKATKATKPLVKKSSPRKALANTLKLLRARQEAARAPKSWETLPETKGAIATEGYQSPEARDGAMRLHEAEIHQPAILGSISSQVRKAQGKRDHGRR